MSLANAYDDIPPSSEGPPIEQMRLGVSKPTILALTLGSEPQAVPIAADPPLGVPVQPARGLVPLPFQLVQ